MKLGFGTWRFLLAFFVCISHLWAGMMHGPAAYAVWGFFVLSGFLMTHIISNRYGITSAGLKNFAFNRFLRIYPLYWIACVLGVVSLYFLPRLGITPSDLNPQFLRPQDAGDWLNNITLLPITGGHGLFVPVSGALAVEVGVYILMPLMAMSKPAAWLGLILSVALNLHFGLDSGSFALRYSSFLTSFAAFTLGALVSQYSLLLDKFRAPVLSVFVWIAHCLIWFKFSLWPWTYGLYVSALLSAWVVLSLAKIKTGRLDNILGEMSYPLYLLHTTVGVWVLVFHNSMRSFSFFAISFGLTLLLSWLIIVLIDRPLHRLKRPVAEPVITGQ